ncbi:hypothetical protein AB0A95_34180 [Micromonospora sp. NPDC049230]|uniref:hypothetical protein n=1 Tax=Micromonospora sp. NPDC049230 TaxID=3155502 RepID=UPI0033CCE68C
MTGPRLRGGDLVRLTTTASVQFFRPIIVRVIRELDHVTYDGWVWLDGYELGEKGDAVARRELYVRREGVQLIEAAPTAAPGIRQPVRRTPARVR